MAGRVTGSALVLLGNPGGVAAFVRFQTRWTCELTHAPDPPHPTPPTPPHSPAQADKSTRSSASLSLGHALSRLTPRTKGAAKVADWDGELSARGLAPPSAWEGEGEIQEAQDSQQTTSLPTYSDVMDQVHGMLSEPGEETSPTKNGGLSRKNSGTLPSKYASPSRIHHWLSRPAWRPN